jgi:hypothetical protein
MLASSEGPDLVVTDARGSQSNGWTDTRRISIKWMDRYQEDLFQMELADSDLASEYFLQCRWSEQAQ